MFIFRRNKFMDFVVCAAFCLLIVYAYYTRQVLLRRLQQKEILRQGLEESAASLKEELKIVYYHTSKLEEALKGEKVERKGTEERLATQARDYLANITQLQKLFEEKVRTKDMDIEFIQKESVNMKEKHDLLQRQYEELSQEHQAVSIKSKTEYDALKKAKETESISLQDRIQEMYNQKVYFQKKALTNEQEYKKALKKFNRCKTILSHRNSSSSTRNARIPRKRKTSSTRKQLKPDSLKNSEALEDDVKEVIKYNDEPNLPIDIETKDTSVKEAVETNKEVDISRDNVHVYDKQTAIPKDLSPNTVNQLKDGEMSPNGNVS